MKISEQLFFTLFMIFWVLWAASTLYFYASGDKFYKLLYERYPEYYRSIGRPRYFSSNVFRNFRASYYLSDLLVKGIPHDLPQDDEIAAMAQQLRSFELKQCIAFAIFFVFFVYFGATA